MFQSKKEREIRPFYFAPFCKKKNGLQAFFEKNREGRKGTRKIFTGSNRSFLRAFSTGKAQKGKKKRIFAVGKNRFHQ